jgi:hypothetical protein
MANWNQQKTVNVNIYIMFRLIPDKSNSLLHRNIKHMLLCKYRYERVRFSGLLHLIKGDVTYASIGSTNIAILELMKEISEKFIL